eukprot:CAMPEP_0174322644 /NCGR_PEP_ID=MMETSP0810-20121108/11153_1 /TAXON_ID=73025 ORGANISM="Eutreptiella gymnastica-like, Strain CCMP1594" /NCGR_SAMPLE_ID=MMETSP0810 /ASSEMBLY_ACC=CAM_ASM_000659 /LENGTH=65 /DNA_ID=CAMNT_0015434557 /DNA_START=135 /DNA_END=330 /DNA_ORIENTATION=-
MSLPSSAMQDPSSPVTPLEGGQRALGPPPSLGRAGRQTRPGTPGASGACAATSPAPPKCAPPPVW